MMSDRMLHWRHIRSILRRPLAVGQAMIAKIRSILSHQFIERHAGSLLIGIVGIGILLRLPRLVWGSIWYDEFLTITTIQFPWRQIATGGYPKELHPPLYFLVLKGWTMVFGQTELAMRLLSLFFTLGSMIVLFLFVRQLTDLRAALGTTLLFAVHPTYIYYATEIRMYAMLILCCLVALFAAWRYSATQHSSPIALFILGIAVLAALYTHYFGILIALGVGVLSLVRLILIRDRRLLAVLTVLLGCAIIYIPSVYFILQRQIHEYRMIYLISIDQRLTWQIFPGLLSGSPDLLFSKMTFTNGISLLTAIVGGVVLWRNGRSVVVLTLVWFILLAALLAFLVSANGVQVVQRYLIHVSVVSLILIGSTCMWQTPARRWFNPGVLGIWMLSLYFYSGAAFALRSTQLHPNWRAVSTLIKEINQPNEPIILLGWDATPIQFYLPDHIFLTSYDLETALQKQAQRSSYLLVQSEYGREITLSKQTNELWQFPEDNVSVLRYMPSSEALFPAAR